MNLFKGKTLTARLIIAYIICVIYTALAYYLIAKYLGDDKLYYLYFSLVTLFLIVFYCFITLIIYKTDVKPLREILAYADSLNGNTLEKHNDKTYHDTLIEQLNISFNTLNSQTQIVKDSNKKFIEAITISSIQPIEDSRVALQRIVNGGAVTVKEAKTVLDGINRLAVKLNLLKEIAMIDSGYYAYSVENINIITALNDCIYERSEHILKKKLNVEYDFSDNNIFGKTDQSILKKVFGEVFDICILQLLDAGTFRIIADGAGKDFSIKIATDAEVISKTQSLVLLGDYISDDAENIIVLKLLIIKKLCNLIDITFVLDTNTDGITVFKFFN